MRMNGRQPNLEDIEAFVAVAERGGFAAAAKKLERDPSVLSRRVSQLEARLGVRLLARTTRRVSLTDAGVTYLKRVQGVLEELAIADREASDKAATLKGTIRATFPNTFGRMWVAPLLPGFLSAHPQIRIEATFTDRFTDVVAEGFDVAIRIGVMRDSSLTSRKLADHRTLLCASPRYLAAREEPRSPDELAQHSCLGFSGYSFWPNWPLRKGAKRKLVRPHCPFVTDNAETALIAAIDGAGIVLTADWLAGPALRTGRLVEVLPGWRANGDGGVYAVLPPGKLIPAKSKALVDHLAEGLRRATEWAQLPGARVKHPSPR
jgi:DNA-binding transcriptional LysR family regulator